MCIVQFIVSFCFVAILVMFTIGLCGIFGGLAWMCVKDTIIDWKQYRLKDRVITIQEYNELMSSLQEVEQSLRTLENGLRAKGLLD